MFGPFSRFSRRVTMDSKIIIQKELKTPLGTYIIKGSSYSSCTAYIKTKHEERQVQELGGGRLTFTQAMWHYDTVCIAQQDKIAEWKTR